MRKANADSSTVDDADAVVIRWANRHDEAWSEWERIGMAGGFGEDDPRADAFHQECDELERRIIATAVHTPAGLAVKRRIIALAGFDGGEIAAIMLGAEAERIAAAR